jgi:hypothetical protein
LQRKELGPCLHLSIDAPLSSSSEAETGIVLWTTERFTPDFSQTLDEIWTSAVVNWPKPATVGLSTAKSRYISLYY